MSLKIREAKPEDIEKIFNFICELANYERLRDDVSATPELLFESLFVKKQAEVLIAELADEPSIKVDSSITSGSFTAIGFALFFHNFSTFKGRACLYLEDIYINPEFRGKGYGKQMFKELAAIAVKRDCDRFEWSVQLSFTNHLVLFQWMNGQYTGLPESRLEKWLNSEDPQII